MTYTEERILLNQIQIMKGLYGISGHNRTNQIDLQKAIDETIEHMKEEDENES